MQPPVVVDRAAGFAGVAEHLRGRPDQHLAVTVTGPLAEGDLDGGKRDPAPAGTVPGVAPGGRRCLPAVLGQPVSGGDPRLDGGQFLADAPIQGDVGGRPAEGERAEAAQVGRMPLQGVEQSGGHRRHGAPAGDAVRRDQAYRLVGVEPASREHERLADYDGADEGLHAADVEQRSRVECDAGRRLVQVLGEPSGDGQQRVQTGDDGPMRQLHRLRGPGAAGREEDQRRLDLVVAALPLGKQSGAGVRRPRADRGAGGQPGGQAVVGEHETRLEQRDGVFQFAGAPPGVGEDRDGAEPEHRPRVHDPVGAVPPEQRDAVTGPDPLRLQGCGPAAHSDAQITEVEPGVTLHHVCPARPAVRVVQQRRQAAHPGRVHAVRDATHPLDHEVAPPGLDRCHRNSRRSTTSGSWLGTTSQPSFSMRLRLSSYAMMSVKKPDGMCRFSPSPAQFS